MLNMRSLKTAGSFVKDILEVVSPLVVTGMILREPSKYKPMCSYNDVIVAIMNSGLWSDDKTEIVSILPMYAKQEFYKAVIDVIKSSMFPSDKAKLILKMCKQVKEA